VKFPVDSHLTTVLYLLTVDCRLTTKEVYLLKFFTMQKYELVLLLSSQVQESERTSFLSKIENTFKDNIIQKDDIGLKETAYDVNWKSVNNMLYYVSYYMNLDNTQLEELKKNLLYTNIVVRYEIFRMKKDDPMVEFAKVQEELQKIMDSRDDKRFGNKISFLSHAENDKYINWKSIVILKKYLTRFGEIKPRSYTKNSVKTQKKLRQEIIRARGLWLLEFIRR